MLLKESLSVESLSMTDAFPQMQDAPAFVEFDSAEVARLLRSNPMRSLRQVSVLLQVSGVTRRVITKIFQKVKIEEMQN